MNYFSHFTAGFLYQHVITILHPLRYMLHILFLKYCSSVDSIRSSRN
nr:MAG TPA: hypothetical protein [Caudoviricetes sp.]